MVTEKLSRTLVSVVKHLYSFIFLFFSACCTLTAQDTTIDSISNLLKTTKVDTLRLKYLMFLSENTSEVELEKYTKQLRFESERYLRDTASKKMSTYRKQFGLRALGSAINNIGYMNMSHGDFSQAIVNFEKALTIFRTYHLKTEIYSTLTNLAAACVQTGQTTKAIEILHECLIYFGSIGDLINQSNCISNLAYIYQDQGDISNSLKQNFEALKIREKLNDTLDLGYSYINIGSLYQQQKDTAKAREFYRKALKSFSSTKNKRGLAYSYNSLGSSFTSYKDTTMGFMYYRKSAAISKELEDKLALANVITNIGRAYVQNSFPEIGIKYLLQGLEINKSTNNRKGVGACLCNIGVILRDQKKFSEAINYGKEAVSIAQELGLIEDLRNASELLYTCYKSTNNNSEALKMHELMITSRDSLVNQKNRKAAIYSQFQYDFDKKESKITAEKDKILLEANAEKRRQYIIVISVCFILLVVIIFSGFLMRSRKQIQKANITILAQKEEVEEQKHLVDEKNKEITESINYAKRIQQTLLASKTLLSNNLENYFVYFNPKDIVSGDFYWATRTEDKFYLIVADSTGHGVPGAFMSLLNIGFLSEAIKERSILSCDEILNYVRKRLVESLAFDNSTEGNNDGMDCCLMAFDMKNKALEFACANNPIVIIRQNKLIEFDPDKMPVGRSPKQDLPFTKHTIQLEKGDRVYAFTDGYSDQFGGPKGKKFRHKNFEELLLSFNEISMEEQQQAIQSRFEEWKGDLDQIDDVLVFGLKI